MNREDILEKAKKQKDERQLQIEVKANNAGGIVATALTTVIYAGLIFYSEVLNIEGAVNFDTCRVVLLMILASSWATRDGYKYFNLKDKSSLAVFIISGVASLFAIAVLVLNFIG